jgi:hypothetical protein
MRPIRTRLKNVRWNPTSQEIEAMARIFRILGKLPDMRSRIDVTAAVVKVAIFEPDHERHAAVLKAAGWPDEAEGQA